MPEIRALIVDDEPMARRGIRQLLAPYNDIEVVGECRDGGEAVRDIQALDPDLVFLDIRMPGVDGLQVIRSIGVERMPMTVFVTAFDEFAVTAFETNALDYLVKPISESRFQITIERVRKTIQVDDALALARRLAALLANTMSPGDYSMRDFDTDGDRLAGAAYDGNIVVPTTKGERRIAVSEIDWIEARDDYVSIHAGRNQYLLRDSISALERRLDPASFARIHRSAIVRLDRIREWTTNASGGGGQVILHDGTSLNVSRRRLPRLKAILHADRPAR